MNRDDCHGRICNLVGPGPAHWCEAPLQAIKVKAPLATVLYNSGTDPAAAAALAAASDVAVVFANQWELEGQNLQTLHLTVDDQAIEQNAAVNPHTIVVREHGSPVIMPWIYSVQAVLAAWYPGIRGADGCPRGQPPDGH